MAEIPTAADVAAEAASRWRTARAQLRHIAEHAGEWAGIPMPIEGTRMVVDPAYPFAALFADQATADGAGDDGGLTLRSRFWSSHRSGEVLVMQTAEGRVDWGIVPGVNHFDMALATMGAAVAWGVEQESAALELLHDLLTPHAFRAYLLTGMFLEHSPRSGVHYVFRRLRPTIAMTLREGVVFRRYATPGVRILAALCLHPIAYYAGSWAGAMCPTDDVIAHLMLMRGDERLFWSRANQHPAWRREAGI